MLGGFISNYFMGKWTTPFSVTANPTQSEHWPYWYEPASERVYECKQGEWGFYPRGARRGRGLPKYRYDDWTAGPLPAQVQPASCHSQLRANTRKPFYLVLQAVDKRNYGEDDELPDTQQQLSWQDRVNRLPIAQRWAVSNVQLTHGAIENLVSDIRQGTAIGVSDGSYKEDFGTAAWQVEGAMTSQADKTAIRGQLVVPGDPRDQSAYRSELSGLYGIVTMVNLLCTHYDISKGKVTIACDGDSALWMAIDSHGPVGPDVQQFDMIAAIRAQVAKSKVEWVSRQVQGHQDKNPYNVLDRFETLNCEMDASAKEHWEEKVTTAYSFEIHGSPGSISINGRAFHTKVRQALYDHIHGKKLLRFWDERKRFGDPAMGGGTSQVDWDVVKRTNKLLPSARQHWLVKQVARVSATGQNMARRKERTSDKCPRCKELTEDNTHVLLCQHSTAQKVWDTQLELLQEVMDRHDTAFSVSEAIIHGLRAWYKSEPLEPPDTVSNPEVIAAYHQQTAIGWRAFMEGCPGTQWAFAQEQIFKRNQKTAMRSGKTWMRMIAAQMVSFSFALWEDRNAAEHDRDRSILITEADRAIDKEFNKGFRDLRQIGFPVRSTIKGSSLEQKRAWLHRVKVQREALERRKESTRTPRWVLETMGHISWTRAGRPAAPTEAMMSQYSQLRAMFNTHQQLQQQQQRRQKRT